MTKDELIAKQQLDIDDHKMEKESQCRYTNTLNNIHSKIVTYKDYWLFTEVFCLLHDNNDFCNCRERLRVWHRIFTDLKTKIK